MVGDKIRKLIHQNGYTYREIARLSGCSPSAIARYVSNQRVPRLETMERLAIALKCEIEDIGGMRRNAN
jgi:transcriptional regulator with XRE-family HTH domain